MIPLHHLGFIQCTSRLFHLESQAITDNDSQARKQDKPHDVAAVFCEPYYWQQEVMATIDILTSQPLDVKVVGERQPLVSEMFNATMFETSLNAGSAVQGVRADILPTDAVPTYYGAIVNTELSPVDTKGISIHPMACLAALAGRQPLEAYLQWENLAESYIDAYKLIFARVMVDVLGNEILSSKQVSGQQRIVTEALVLEPIFVYVVEGLLVVLSISTISLLYLSFGIQGNLVTAPGTIASIMSLVADSQPLLSDFESLHCCTIEEMKDFVGNKRYKLIQDKGSIR
jgi:hypothetical protein